MGGFDLALGVTDNFDDTSEWESRW